MTLIKNAKLILANEVINGGLRLENGKITEIFQGATAADGYDFEGDYLAPGLIELHTDNLENHIQPRPKTYWPMEAAIRAHDAELASVGITTVFDALRVGTINDDFSTAPSEKGAYARKAASAIQTLQNAGELRISHMIHLRAEVCSTTLTAELDAFGEEDGVRLISVMDHTPGQRQFVDLEKFRQYTRLSPADFEAHASQLYDVSRRFAAQHVQDAIKAAARLGAVLASHDDTDAAQVRRSAELGIKLAEFPTTQAAATACQAQGILTMMGAPNLIRGGSHSGNVAAIELAKAGLLDVLSSDYVPASLLLGALILADEWDDLPRGFGTVSSGPAQALGLTDRGQIALGLRGDFLRLSAKSRALRETWAGAQRTA